MLKLLKSSIILLGISLMVGCVMVGCMSVRMVDPDSESVSWKKTSESQESIVFNESHTGINSLQLGFNNEVQRTHF